MTYNLGKIFDKLEKDCVEHTKIFGGDHYKFMFKNGFGASMVRHIGSYGGIRGLWEIAVLCKNGDLCYWTDITDDVIGNLTDEEACNILTKIKYLNRYGRLKKSWMIVSAISAEKMETTVWLMRLKNLK